MHNAGHNCRQWGKLLSLPWDSAPQRTSYYPAFRAPLKNNQIFTRATLLCQVSGKHPDLWRTQVLFPAFISGLPTKLDYSIWLYWQYTLDCPSFLSAVTTRNAENQPVMKFLSLLRFLLNSQWRLAQSQEGWIYISRLSQKLPEACVGK